VLALVAGVTMDPDSLPEPQPYSFLPPGVAKDCNIIELQVCVARHCCKGQGSTEQTPGACDAAWMQRSGPHLMSCRWAWPTAIWVLNSLNVHARANATHTKLLTRSHATHQHERGNAWGQMYVHTTHSHNTAAQRT